MSGWVKDEMIRVSAYFVVEKDIARPGDENKGKKRDEQKTIYDDNFIHWSVDDFIAQQ